MPIRKRTSPRFRLTNSTTVVVIRPGEPTYVNGRKVEGIPSEHEIEANVQPLNHREELLLPESDRTKEWVKGFCDLEQDIRAMREGDGGWEADKIIWDGEEFKVMRIKLYKMGVLDHRMFLAARTPISAGEL